MKPGWPKWIKNYISKTPNRKGQGLVEIIIAIGVFAIAGISLIYLILGAFQSTRVGSDYFEAMQYVNEGWESVKSIERRAYNELIESPTTYGLDDSSGEWEFSGTSNTNGRYTRTIEINSVDRDTSGNITSSGTPDIHTREVLVNVSWDITEGRSVSVGSTFYSTDWDSEDWFEDTTSDFDDGTFTNTEATSIGDGEVALEELVAAPANWQCVESEGQFDASGTADAYDVDVVGTTAYIVRASSTADELVIIDISTPSSPTQLGSLDLGITANAIKVSGNYAYIATISDTQELMVVDISNPSSLSIDGSYDAAGTANATDIFIVGNRAYLARESSAADEFFILNITTPTSPTLVNSYNAGAAVNGIYIDGTEAYLATSDDSQELMALDISTELSISLDDSVDLPGSQNALDVTVDDNSSYAYLIRENNFWISEFFVMDVTDPTSISNIDDINIGGTSNEVAIDGDYALVANQNTNNELTVIDISTPSSVVIATTYDLDGVGNGIAIENGNAFIATGNDGAELFIVGTASGWACPQEVSTFDANGNANPYDLFIENDTIYMVRDSGTSDELVIIDVTDRSSPSFLGSINLGVDANDIHVSNGYAYIATDSNTQEMMVIDISNPSSLSIDGSYDAPGSANAEAVYVSGNRAYLGRASSFQDEFFILDISTPTSPSFLDSGNASSTIRSIYVNGSYAYVATTHNNAEVATIDISADTFIVADTLDLVGTADARDIFVSGSYAYVARASSAEDEFYIIDISVPTTLSETGSLEIGASANSVWSDGTTAFLGNDANLSELVIIDVSVPASPSQISTYDVGAGSGDVNGVDGDSNYIYLASEDNSMELVIIEQTSGGGGGGAAQIIDDTQSEFDAGTYSDTQWNTDHVELDATGLANGTGTYTSQIFDSGDSSTSWDQISWVEDIGPRGELRMEVGSVTVDGTFTTVNLQQSYQNPVVIPFYYENSNSDDISPRLDNVTTNSFDIALQSPSGASISSDTVHYLVIEQGTFTMPDGTLIEAGTINTSTVSSLSNGWSGTTVNFSNTYPSAPAVLHAVQTSNDSTWIESWVASPTSASNPPSLTGFQTSLNGAEAVNSHSAETIGWVAIETGTGTINGINYEAQRTTDSIRGHDNGCYTRSFLNTYSNTPLVIAKQEEMDGNNGGWSVGCSLSTTSIGQHIEEDLVGDWERAHTTETTAFIAFESAFVYSSLDLTFQIRSCDDPACSGESFVGPDGTGSTVFTNPNGEAINAPVNQYFQYKATFSTDDPSYSPELSSVTINYTPGGGGGTYETSGTYISNAFDAGTTSNWNTIEWTEDMSSCSGCDIQLQIRTSTTEAGLSSELWQGPDGKDGDESDYYTDAAGELIHTDHNGDRWIQYRATLTGDGNSTPYLEDITISYTNW